MAKKPSEKSKISFGRKLEGKPFTKDTPVPDDMITRDALHKEIRALEKRLDQVESGLLRALHKAEVAANIAGLLDVYCSRL